MTCLETINAYALRSMGWGERLLPREDFTLCQQFTLIGSGLLWNIYFGILALALGFVLANAVALGRNSPNRLIRKSCFWGLETERAQITAMLSLPMRASTRQDLSKCRNRLRCKHLPKRCSMEIQTWFGPRDLCPPKRVA